MIRTIDIMEASDVDLRKLRHFLAVLEAGGVREASRRVHVAQPALSRTVAELEEALGQPLFLRTGRRMEPTTAAEALAEDARAILGEMAALVARARARAEGVAGALRLGSSPSATFHPRVPALIRAVRDARPGLELELVEGSTADLVEALLARRVDAAFVRPSGALPEALHARVLAREPLVAAVPSGHPLAGRRSVRPATLFEEPLLLPSPHLGSSLGALIDRLALEHGARPRVVAHASHVASLVHLAATGMGVAFVPACLRSLRARGVRFVPVAAAGARLPLLLASAAAGTPPALEALWSLARRG
jgi:DNA-binding transcriptional LysR family regulator